MPYNQLPGHMLLGQTMKQVLSKQASNDEGLMGQANTCWQVASFNPYNTMRGWKSPKPGVYRVRDVLSGPEWQLWLMFPQEKRDQEKAPCPKVPGKSHKKTAGSQRWGLMAHKEILDDIYGGGAHPPIPHFISSKTLWSLLLSAHIFISFQTSVALFSALLCHVCTDIATLICIFRKAQE